VNALDRFEKLMERLIEGPFDRLFKRRLHPADVARALAQAMAAGQTTDGRGGVLVPNYYQVLLSEEDFRSLGESSALREEVMAIERYLSGLMVEAGWESAGPLQVSVEPLAHIQPGRVQVTADHLAVEGLSSLEETQRLKKKGLATSADQWSLRLADREIALGRAVIRIGREANNDVVLDDPAVANYHAQLRWRDGAYYLQPLNRDQPLQVNHQPLTETILLKPGDLLQIGPVTLQLQLQQ
jgi:hypothetical protein